MEITINKHPIQSMCKLFIVNTIYCDLAYDFSKIEVCLTHLNKCKISTCPYYNFLTVIPGKNTMLFQRNLNETIDCRFCRQNLLLSSLMMDVVDNKISFQRLLIYHDVLHLLTAHYFCVQNSRGNHLWEGDKPVQQIR